MRFGVLLGVSLGFAITCQALPAQPSASANDYAIRRRAHVSVVPALRGDLSVTISTYRFSSRSDSELPQPFEVRLGTAWSPSRLTLPFGITLLAPVLLAFWLRRRAERKGAIQAEVVWLYWILTGTWLYWISSVSPADIAALVVHLQFDSMALTFLISSAVYAVPPLIAMGTCVGILVPTVSEAGEQRRTGGSMLRPVARSAVVIVPLAMLLVGGGMFDQDVEVSMASLPAAYFTYRVLGWCVGRWFSGRQE